MAGVGLAVGVVASAGALALALAAVGGAAVSGRRLAAAADAAALAAADTVSGAVSGIPCDRAGVVAASGGATLAECHLDGLIATVTVTATYLGFDTVARARAGPPEELP